MNYKKSFRLSESGFRMVQIKLILILGPTILFAFAAILYIMYINETDRSSFFGIMPFLIPFFIIITIAGLTMGIKKRKQVWESYSLIVDHHSISRIQKELTPLKIKKEEIDQIIEFSSGDFLIKSLKKGYEIDIPSAIQERNNLMYMLYKLKPITQRPSGSKKWLIPLAALVPIVLLIIFYSSEEKYIVVPTGILLILVVIGSFVEVQKNKLIDDKQKEGFAGVIVIIAIVIYRFLKIFDVF